MALARLLLVTSIWSLVGANALAEPQSDDAQVVFNFFFFLEQLKEPDLRESCSNETQTIRLIANAMSKSAWSVRVEHTESVVTVYFSQGKTLGTPTISSRTMDDSTWTDLQRILETENIREIPVNGDTWIPDDTIASIETCIDGRYRVIQRQFWHPETKELVSALQSLRPGE
jgi:hypothetical protein